MDRFRCRHCRSKSCLCKSSSGGEPSGGGQDRAGDDSGGGAIASPRVSSTTCTPSSRSRDRQRRSPRRAALEGRRRRASRANSRDRRWPPRRRSRSRSRSRSRCRSPSAPPRPRRPDLDATGRRQRHRGRSPPAPRPDDADGPGVWQRPSRSGRPCSPPPPPHVTRRPAVLERLGAVLPRGRGALPSRSRLPQPLPLMQLQVPRPTALALRRSPRRGDWRDQEDGVEEEDGGRHRGARASRSRSRTSRLDKDATIHCSVRNDHWRPQGRAVSVRRRGHRRSRTPPVRFRVTIGTKFPSPTAVKATTTQSSVRSTTRDVQIESLKRASSASHVQSVIKKVDHPVQMRSVIEQASAAAERATPEPATPDVRMSPAGRARGSSWATPSPTPGRSSPAEPAVEKASPAPAAAPAAQVHPAAWARCPVTPTDTLPPALVGRLSLALQSAVQSALLDGVLFQSSGQQHDNVGRLADLAGPAPSPVPGVQSESARRSSPGPGVQAPASLLGQPVAAGVDRSPAAQEYPPRMAAPAQDQLFHWGPGPPAGASQYQPPPPHAAPAQFYPPPHEQVIPTIQMHPAPVPDQGHPHPRFGPFWNPGPPMPPRGWLAPCRRPPPRPARAATRTLLTPLNDADPPPPPAPAPPPPKHSRRPPVSHKNKAVAAVTSAAAALRSEMDAGAAAVKEQLRRNLERAAIAMGIAPSSSAAEPPVPPE